MRKLIFFIVSIFLSITIYSNVSVYASNIDTVSVEQTGNFILLNWADQNEVSEVALLDGESNKYVNLWDGESNYYFFNHNGQSDWYKFRIRTFNENGLIKDTYYVNTKVISEAVNTEESKEMNFIQTAIDSQPQVEFPMTKSRIDTIITTSYVKLKWHDLPDEDEKYELLRDGELIAVVEGNEYTDFNIDSERIYTYTIKGSKRVSEQKVKKIKSELLQNNLTIGHQEEALLFFEPKILTALVATSDKNVLSLMSSESKSQLPTSSIAPFAYETPSGTGFLLRYTTFIPLEKAPNPWCTVICSTYDEFGGDNRSYNVWHARFRTRSDVYVTWDGSNKYIIQNKQTGITTGYKDGILVDTGQADADKDMKIWNVELQNNYIYHRMALASPNPLTPSPDIDAFYYAKVYKTGIGEFYGVHDQAPSHEFYIIDYPSYSNVRTIHLYPHQGFTYLFPWTAKAEFNVTIN